MKIRTVKPDFWRSEVVASLAFEVQLFFIGLWNVADDHGRFRAHRALLRGELFPYHEDQPLPIETWLLQLEQAGLITLYVVDGTRYGHVRGFVEHQKIDKRAASKYPAPPQSSARDSADVAEQPEEPARKVAEPADTAVRHASSLALDLEVEEEVEEEVPRAGARGPRRRSAPREPDKPEDVPEQTWSDWLEHRKAKRAPVTQTAIDEFRREAANAGMALADALAMSTAQGWQGFRADWAAKQGPSRPGKPGVPAALNAAGVRVTHPERMPIPYNSPTGDCQCDACKSARARRKAQ